MTENEAIKEMKYYSEEEYGKGLVSESHKTAIKALEEIQQYRAIGTVEELKALKEKNKLIKPRFVMNKRSDTVSIWECRCGNLFRTKNKEGVLDGIDVNYCSKCGVKLDWE